MDIRKIRTVYKTNDFFQSVIRALYPCAVPNTTIAQSQIPNNGKSLSPKMHPSIFMKPPAVQPTCGKTRHALTQHTAQQKHYWAQQREVLRLGSFSIAKRNGEHHGRCTHKRACSPDHLKSCCLHSGPNSGHCCKLCSSCLEIRSRETWSP